MLAYLIIYKNDGTIIRKNGIPLEEAKKMLTKKQFEQLCDFWGIHSKKVDGYIK